MKEISGTAKSKIFVLDDGPVRARFVNFEDDPEFRGKRGLGVDQNEGPTLIFIGAPEQIVALQNAVMYGNPPDPMGLVMLEALAEARRL